MTLRAAWKGWALAASAWAAVALSYATSSYLTARGEGRMVTWAALVGWHVGLYGLWFAFSPFIMRLAHRVGFEGADWPRALLIHLGAGSVASALHLALFLPLYWQVGSPQITAGRTLAEALRLTGLYRFHQGLLTYGMLVLALYALHHHRRGDAERLRASELETQLAQARLQALRMQLQPHFLFNTLNAISALVLMDPPQAKTMIARLGDFLSLTLEHAGSPVVSLREELRFLESYLAIETVRFQDRLAFRLQADREALEFPIPHLLLQPLVENALRHGLAPKPGPGTLSVAVRMTDRHVEIAVEDDGVGLPPESGREGIGLANTRARLKAFAPSGELSLSPRSEGGTRSLLRIPLEAAG